jgi:hypothetical protein
VREAQEGRGRIEPGNSRRKKDLKRQLKIGWEAGIRAESGERREPIEA